MKERSGAILTGSQVYGTPTKESDIDLVVLVNEKTANALQRLDDTSDGEDRSAGEGSFSLRFGTLNLIVLTDHRRFMSWVDGTKELGAKKPVERSVAVKRFKELFAAEANG